MSKSITPLRPCLTCGASFQPDRREVARGKGTYCSRRCAGFAKPKTPPAERFWAKVQKSDDPHGCWVFSSGSDYGQVSRPNGKGGKRRTIRVAAHRFSYELHFGPIRKGLLVLHKCDHPPCVNPAHLFLGTQRDNMADCARKGRGSRGRTGLQGEKHPAAKLTAANVRVIRELAASGIPRSKIASRFQVTRGTVGEIVRRTKWKHVT